ncbi:cytochrome b/b6 domain-containing protein [Aurantiacibacter rhizosphaerae]|uniref:Cytochrome b/b6 domain-containing protein n=1 Tax=Aurantiacibacter rhizosphaerae TaxID=2691582 RepID=A0A844XGU7_9SPHN|nr:cytochrome b/b6 domain-containing protein [Aurantiacibacter rhizosphaerae]MWV29246.1 cytochrome b/b6 domain-containing protein [Aurantiacibacter rhizosphaerae]
MTINRYKHSWPTRLFHAALALSIITQLATSQFMVTPKAGRPENVFFEIHEYSGLTALVLATLFFLNIAFRNRGTEAGLLFPWFSGARLRALGADISQFLKSAAKFRLPPYHSESPIASAVHGLGLLLMALMASTGALWWAGGKFGVPGSQITDVAMEVHEIFSNLVWVYLIGHAAMALIHHYTDQMSLKEMWSLKKHRG